MLKPLCCVCLLVGCLAVAGCGMFKSPYAKYDTMRQVDTSGMTEAEAAEALRQAENRARNAERIYEDRRRNRYNGLRGGAGR